MFFNFSHFEIYNYSVGHSFKIKTIETAPENGTKKLYIFFNSLLLLDKYESTSLFVMPATIKPIINETQIAGCPVFSISLIFIIYLY